MNVSLEIEVNGKRRTFNVPVEIAQYIGDLRQQNTMLRKVMDKNAEAAAPSPSNMAARTGGAKHKDR